MSKAYTLKPDAVCGKCKKSLKEGMIYTIIYEDDDSGKINHLLCDDCEVDDRIQYYRDTGIISSKLSSEATTADYYFNERDSLDGLIEEAQHFYSKYKKDLLKITEESKEIHSLIREFDVKHWLAYLKKYWNDTNIRGHSAKVGSIKVLMWGSAGRVLITARNEQEITMIFSDEKDNDSRGGQQSIYATAENAIQILQTLVKADKIKFKADKEVSISRDGT